MKLKIPELVFLFIGLSLLLSTSISFAYRDDYPPYKFKDGPPAHLNVKPLVSGEGDYKSKDGSVIIHLDESNPSGIDFSFKVNKTVLISPDEEMEVFPSAVFQADLDNNGFDDFIVFYNLRGCGLAAHQDCVEIYLRKNKGGFEKISYDTFDAGIEDFIGPDAGGKFKVVITGFYQGNRHNYFTYNIYEFRDCRLINADAKVKGFPKFVRYTYKNNDQDAIRLTKQERSMYTKKKDGSIKYEDIPQY